MMNEATIKANIREWKKANYLELAKHFHAWDEDAEQFKRVHHFEMEQEFLDKFNNLGVISEINICLSIDPNKNEGFSLYPFLEIFHDGEMTSPAHLPLEGKAEPAKVSPPTSDIVPGIFKEMITRNWQKMDYGLINDLFVAEKERDATEKHVQLVRVHYFWIGDKMVSHIESIRKANPSGVDGISLYPGVDMNKFQDKNMISFTPVLGILHENKSEVLDLFGVIEQTKYETFIEYTSPCPPTCRKGIQ